MNKEIYLFSPDFKPMSGGVAEYTYQMARVLGEIGTLKSLITTVLQTEEYPFPVRGLKESEYGRKLDQKFGDSISILRRINSFIYYFTIVACLVFEILKISKIRKEKLLVITYTYSFYSKIVFWICKITHIKYSIVLHGYDILCLIKSEPKYLEKICSNSQQIIFNSVATKNLFDSKDIINSYHSYVLYPGLDIENLANHALEEVDHLSQQINLDLTNKKIILSVTRFVKRKGIDLAIKSLEKTLKSNQGLIYVIAGEGPEYKNYLNLVDELNLREKVFIVGRISDIQKYSLMRLSSIFIMPSHSNRSTDFEGFGISFIEASFFENIIIAGRNGGILEAVEDKVSGLLVDAEAENFTKEVEDFCSFLASNTDKENRLKLAAKTRVIQNFDINKLIPEFVKQL